MTSCKIGSQGGGNSLIRTREVPKTPIGRSVHTLAPYCGHIDGSANGDKGQHSNVSDMAIHAEDSGIFDRSVPDSHTTDAYSVDLLNSD